MPVNSDPQFSPVLFKLPGVKSTPGGLTCIDADMADQILGRGRDAVSGEVVRRSHGPEPPVRADPDGNHVPVDALAQSHAGIEAFLDNIAHAIVAMEFDMDIRIVGEYAAQLRPDGRLQGVIGQGEAHGA